MLCIFPTPHACIKWRLYQCHSMLPEACHAVCAHQMETVCRSVTPQACKQKSGSHRALQAGALGAARGERGELAQRLAGRGVARQGEPLGTRHQVVRLEARPVVGHLPPLVAGLRRGSHSK
jgi:hypothetical protein